MNIVYYARNNLKTFKQEPFNEVDSVIFSWLSYLKIESYQELHHSFFKRSTIRDLYLAEYLESYLDKVNSSKDSLELLSLLACSPRFRNVKISHYLTDFDKDINKQFAAITFHLDNSYHYVAFRGTDKTLVGWREDFFLSLEKPTQSQIQAAEYLNSVGRFLKGNIIVGGHSKGGNLAVYACTMAKKSIQKKICQIYSHDGPGFPKEFLQKPEFLAIKDRITKLIPQSSLVGLFFEQECRYQIIESNGNGIYQHNPFNWQIKDNSFIKREHLSTDGTLIYHKVHNWIDGMSLEERKKITNLIFDTLEETGVEDFNQFGENLKVNIPIIIDKYKNFSKEDQKFIRNLFYLLITSSSKSLVSGAITENLTIKKQKGSSH